MSPTRLTLSLAAALGASTMCTTPPVSADDDATTHVVTDFGPETPDLGWYVVNDGVMGGRSEGDFERTDGGIDFTGTTNTNGGGFSSIRTRALTLDLAGFDGIRVRVRGDGRRYTWRLTTDARWRGREVGYWADFETVEGEWIMADIPFSEFRPQWRGRQLDGPALDPGRIRGMGLMIYDKRDGPFSLRLDSVHAYRATKPFSMRDQRWKHRVLVVSAASEEDARLLAVLGDVAATRDQFDDRDMLLVVTLDSGRSRGGGRALTADETREVRDALDIERGAFAVRLVGKDGGVKRAADGSVALQDLYDLIDTMPMRRAEMDE